MKAKIDQNKCLGCGMCVNVCPEGITMVDGKAQIKNQTSSCLSEAASVCPISIIDIE